MSIKETLLEIGFSNDQVDLAISKCGENLEQATEWLLNNAGNSDTNSGNNGQEQKNDTTDGDVTQDSNGGSEESKSAKSMKCEECGKLFKTSDEVEFHAVKSGHNSFSESTEEKKPLTEEERKEKLKELETKMAERRKKREEDERKDIIEREKKRIQMGKSMTETKQKFEEQEIKRIAEERRREKLEDKLARQRVKEQIERDRQLRREVAQAQTSSNPVTTAPPPKPEPSNVPKPVQKDYTSTKLQIRLPSGPPIVQEFNAKESLAAVRVWISLNRKDSPAGQDQSFSLSTTFPRKIFSDEDMEKPLNSLGLVPSAVLVVSNK